MLKHDRRLIEDLIPIREISAEASREKSRRHGNISTLHLWWARRPIIAARAAVYGALVSAPIDLQEREMYMQRMRDLCKWDVSQKTLDEARQDILLANDGQPPKVLDMFAGGGSIPLEALRLGCEAYAVDLNPVAHIIELCTLYYPQKYGATLVEDVKKWGMWVIERAKERLAEFYPSPTELTSPDQTVTQQRWEEGETTIQTYRDLTPIAYLWTRTVPCPNPTCGATVPLARQTWLRKKEGKYIALKMTPDHVTKRVRFENVESTRLEDLGFDPESGTKRGNTVCLHCGAPLNTHYIKQEGRNKHIEQQLMAVVLTKASEKGKVYTAEDGYNGTMHPAECIIEQLHILCNETGLTPPDEHMNAQETRWFAPPDYGFLAFKDIFTDRQLLTLLTFASMVHNANTAMLKAGIDNERAKAITTYLGLMVDRLADYNSTICNWHNTGEKIGHTYARQALPMVWDFAEINPFGDGSGNATGALTWIIEVIQTLAGCGFPAHIFRTSATHLPQPENSMDTVITDPPYYDNVSYADLSDFFYVWLKRSIGFLYPEHFSTSLTPKKQETIMASYRHAQNKKLAKQSYETMMAQTFGEAHRVLKAGKPLICVYAHKTTSGWSTLIEALRHAGFMLTEAWPLDTEMKARSVSQGTAALASSIFLVARRRENESTGDYATQVHPQLVEIVQERLTTLLNEKVIGADLVIATIGAGLRAYTQFARVEMSNGDELDATTYLEEVEREVAQHVLQRLLGSTDGAEPSATSAQIAAVDTITRFYITARFFYEEAAVPFDDMNMLARGMGVELGGPRGLTQGKKGLVKKEKNTTELRHYRTRGDEENLGLATESGNAAPLIDILQRLLWLQEKQPHNVANFLLKANANADQLRLVAQALAGHALTPTSDEGLTRQDRTEEQKAIDRLLAGWRNVFTEMSNGTLWG